jgi:hypothetical protein
MIGCDWKSDHHPVDRVKELERLLEEARAEIDYQVIRCCEIQDEVERLRKTTQFLRSERPMARRLTELEDSLERILKEPQTTLSDGKALVQIVKIAKAALAAKKEKP